MQNLTRFWFFNTAKQIDAFQLETSFGLRRDGMKLEKNKPKKPVERVMKQSSSRHLA